MDEKGKVEGANQSRPSREGSLGGKAKNVDRFSQCSSTREDRACYESKNAPFLKNLEMLELGVATVLKKHGFHPKLGGTRRWSNSAR